jgi:ABC-type nickel/cobalt efflux system permease component RcnA
VTIVLIGGWMLITEIRRWRDRRVAQALLATPAHPHEHQHDAHGHDHAAHDHAHAHVHPHDQAQVHEDAAHSHGGVAHRHVPAAGSTITWRSLFVLGLAGGLVPSTNALLILLGTIAAGRPAWGVVLVVAFGLGMAAVMGGVGLLFVSARGFLERLPRGGMAGTATRLMPLGAAVLVLGLGLVLTGQAIGVRPVL